MAHLKVDTTEPTGFISGGKFYEKGVPYNFPGSNRCFFKIVWSAYSGSTVEFGAVAGKWSKINVMAGDTINVDV